MRGGVTRRGVIANDAYGAQCPIRPAISLMNEEQ